MSRQESCGILPPARSGASSRLRTALRGPRIASLAVCAVLAGIAAAARGEVLVIQNATLRVAFDCSAGRFSVAARASGRTFLTDGRLSSGGGEAKLVAVAERALGRGEAIEIAHPNGGGDSMMLFSKLPFAVFRTRLHNNGTEPEVTREIRTVSVEADLGAPAAALRTLGTGGLLAPDKNPGSYEWLALAEPQTRRGVVAGWLSADRGSGVVFTTTTNQQVWIDARIDYGRLRLAPGQTEALETFVLGYFDDARVGLEAWADTVAKVYSIHLPPQPAGYCTWYSRPHGGASDERHLAEQAAFAARELASFGFSVMQIDDGWQTGLSTNGPRRNFTAARANGPYPGGMKAIADKVKALGLVPGLWFMPFAGTHYDPFFKEHPGWFVQRDGGGPYETAWGGTSLDLTRREVQDYLRQNIERITHEWGFQYFKMDGLWTGTATRQMYVNSGYREDGMGDAVFHDPQKTNVEAYRDGLELVRAAAGKGVFILGCCTPQNMRSYGGAFGLVDAMRIGPDNGVSWESLLNGPRFGSRQYFLHGRVWYNDPDPVYVRPDLPLDQARLICSWVTISGQLNLSSEWFPGLPPERLDLLKRTMPGHGLLPRPADLFDEPLPRIWCLTDGRRSPRRDVIGLFNWDDHPYRVDSPLDRIGLDGGVEYVAFDYWANAPAPVIQGRLQTTLPPRSCAVLAVRPWLDHPELIGTSRHITQGIVDVLDEKWNGLTRTLSGSSKVVANDPYELRVVTSGRKERWVVDRAGLSMSDREAGVKARFNQTNGLARVTIESPVSREVRWSVKVRAETRQHRAAAGAIGTAGGR